MGGGAGDQYLNSTIYRHVFVFSMADNGGMTVFYFIVFCISHKKFYILILITRFLRLWHCGPVIHPGLEEYGNYKEIFGAVVYIFFKKIYQNNIKLF